VIPWTIPARTPTVSRPPVAPAGPRLPGLLLASLLLPGLLLVAPGTARCGDDAPLSDGVVARTDGRDVSYAELCLFAVADARADLRSRASIASQVLEMVVEERLARQTARRHGVSVTRADLEAFVDELARERSADLERLRRSLSPREAERRLVHLLLVRRVEATGLRLGDLRPAARIEAPFPIAGPHVVAALEPGVVLSVEGEPVATLELGERLLSAGGAARAAETLDRACRTSLVAAHGWQLTPQAMPAEIEFVERLWSKERDYEAEPVWETRVLHGGKEAAPPPTHGDLLESPYYRALFGLVRHLRAAATGADVSAEIAREREGLYGPSVLVSWVRIEFADRPSPFDPATTRTLRQARALARTLRQRLVQGDAIERLSEEFASRGETGTSFTRERLHGTGASRLVYDRAAALADGEISAPFETLSELNVLVRHELRPAAPTAEIEPVARERLARRRAREWLEAAISDGARVIRARTLPEGR
jgi:hypothetical protein